jgi:molybdate transport system ATP-binding protein
MAGGAVVGAGPIDDMLAGLDLARALGEDAGVVLDAVVGERDPHWQLARLDLIGGVGTVWARDQGLPLGAGVRLRVLARDVSLTRTAQTGTSIANQLPALVEAIADDAHAALALVRVRVGSAPLVVRLTRRSAQALELRPGLALWAQVKTVALMA